ncbi:hypothetical protein GP486_005276 [Trichoglossum hirsutum]|uniref:Uncharacterized protein n=1 Tax=Trichoglossum hirsutum TaxID=265104 RepID=A0A9P8L9K1_9PEZI|nr:hypothetical protein GP486_005276 [Trichoglossum hirsutum]
MANGATHVARVVSVVAATIISLSCGTNYVYSAWAPQFAERLRLSSTESNLIVSEFHSSLQGRSDADSS